MMNNNNSACCIIDAPSVAGMMARRCFGPRLSSSSSSPSTPGLGRNHAFATRARPGVIRCVADSSETPGDFASGAQLVHAVGSGAVLGGANDVGALNEDPAAAAVVQTYEEVESIVEAGASAGVDSQPSGNAAEFDFIPEFMRTWFDGIDKRTSSLVLLNIMTFLMATNCVVVKQVEGSLDPYTFSAARFMVAALVFSPFLASPPSESREKSVIPNKEVIAGLEIGLWSTLGYLLQTLGLKYTDCSKAAFLGGLLVVMVPLIGGIMGKKISNVKWVGAAVAVIGTSFLEQGSDTPFGIGDVYCLLSALFFGIQMIRTEAYSKELPSSSTLTILGIASAATAVISSGIAIYTHPGETLSLIYSSYLHTPYISASLASFPWATVMYTGALTTALVLLIEMLALENVTATDAAIVYTIQPVLSGLMAFAFLGERFTSAGWVGAAIIVCGSLGAQLLSKDEEDEGETMDDVHPVKES